MWEAEIGKIKEELSRWGDEINPPATERESKD